MPVALRPTIHPADALRFDGFVDRENRADDDCWPWVGGKVAGYGTFRYGRRKVRAHRFAWVLWSGLPEPDGPLDHTCHDPATCVGRCPHRACCNPRHMRPSTDRENNSRARRRSPRAERDRCRRGHRFTDANTYRAAGHSGRQCRRCNADNARVRRPIKGLRLDLATHCPHGHLWSEHGRWYNRPTGRARICLACNRLRINARRARGIR